MERNINNTASFNNSISLLNETKHARSIANAVYNKKHSTRADLRRAEFKECETVWSIEEQSLQNVPCFMSDLSCQFHENTFTSSSTMLLTDKQTNKPTERKI